MTEKLKVTIISGTIRGGNKTQYAARFIESVAKEDSLLDVTVVKPDDFNLPGDGNNDEDRDAAYTKLTAESDAFIIVTPEYNHSFPGSLKRLLDSESDNYIHKPVGVCGVSSGGWGGVRVVEHMMPVVRELGLVPIFKSVYFTKSYSTFDESGELVADKERYTSNTKDLLEELVWMAQTLKYGRDKLPNKYHKLFHDLE